MHAAQALQRLYAAAKPRIDDYLVAARAAPPEQRLAFLVEHAPPLGARIALRDRDAVARHIGSDARIPEPLRTSLLARMNGAPAGEVPALLVVRDSRGTVVADVKRVSRLDAPRGFDVAGSMSLGRFLLDNIRPAEGEALADWLDRLRAWVGESEHPSARDVERRLGAPKGEVTLGWTIAWALGGFQRVTVPARLAASLMATNPGEDPEALSCAPWNAYTIEFPPDIVHVPFDGGKVAFDIVCVWHLPDGVGTNLIMASRSSHEQFIGPLRFPLPAFNVESSPEHPTSAAGKAAANRARDRMATLVVCTELEMTEPSHVESRSVRLEGPALERTVGTHRLVREVRDDVRDGIREYIAGGGKSPSVTTLTVGHFQRYWHGKKGAQTFVWQPKEPYWNPRREDAPVAVRPHRLVDDGTGLPKRRRRRKP